VVGALWRGVTRQGAYAGLLGGFLTFAALYLQVFDPNWFDPGPLRSAVAWLEAEGPNPYSCAAMGELVSVLATVLVSRLTRPLPAAHLDAMFGPEEVGARTPA